MNVPKLLVLASLMSLALVTGTAVTSMPPALYAQSNNGSNTGRTHFIAVLNGESVFPPVKTNATGKAELALVGDGKTMSYKITGGPVDNVRGVAISHSTGGRPIDIVVLRSGTQQGLSGQAKSATLAGNFTSADFIRGPKDMATLVKDILSGNVILRVDTLKFPLGIVAGKLKPNLQS
jgi:CHRD domain